MAVTTRRRQKFGHWGRARGRSLLGPSHGQTGQGPVTTQGHEPEAGRESASGRRMGRKESPLRV